jgi:hypothetical protein
MVWCVSERMEAYPSGQRSFEIACLREFLSLHSKSFGHSSRALAAQTKEPDLAAALWINSRFEICCGLSLVLPPFGAAKASEPDESALTKSLSKSQWSGGSRIGWRPASPLVLLSRWSLQRRVQEFVLSWAVMPDFWCFLA